MNDFEALKTLSLRSDTRDQTLPRLVGFTGGVAGLKADASVDFALAGLNLLQGQTFAGKLVGAFLNLWAVVPGADGNAFQVEVIDSAGGGLTVTYVAGTHTLTIDLGGAVSTEAQVATAINAEASCRGIIRADSTGTLGANVVVTPVAPFLGGSGSGFRVFTGGVEVSIHHDAGATSVANLSDTALLILPHDLTAHGFVATNLVTIEVISNGRLSQPLSVPLIA